MDLKQGRVVIQMFPDLAPKHVERIKMLAREGFYDNTPFHRVIEGFMAQGGDPTGTGTRRFASCPTCRPSSPPSGTSCAAPVGAARTSNPNSANSQFFIMFAPAPHLDGQYTIWGQVTQGMEFVDQIKRGSGTNGAVKPGWRHTHEPGCRRKGIAAIPALNVSAGCLVSVLVVELRAITDRRPTRRYRIPQSHGNNEIAGNATGNG